MASGIERNAYEELLNFPPGSKDLPLSRSTFNSPELTVELHRIGDPRNPNTIGVRLSTPADIKSGVISAGLRVSQDGTLEGIIYRNDVIPGIGENDINLTMTPQQKEDSRKKAIVLVDFIKERMHRSDFTS